MHRHCWNRRHWSHTGCIKDRLGTRNPGIVPTAPENCAMDAGCEGIGAAAGITGIAEATGAGMVETAGAVNMAGAVCCITPGCTAPENCCAGGCCTMPIVGCCTIPDGLAKAGIPIGFIPMPI